MSSRNSVTSALRPLSPGWGLQGIDLDHYYGAVQRQDAAVVSAGLSS
jgi:hypothetical protein